MAAAGAIGCSFCLDFHYFMTHNRGLDEAKSREVPRGIPRRSPPWSGG